MDDLTASGEHFFPGQSADAILQEGVMMPTSVDHEANMQQQQREGEDQVRIRFFHVREDWRSNAGATNLLEVEQI